MSLDLVEVLEEQKRFMVKVYAWMSLALLVTGIVAMYTASSQVLIEMIFRFHKFVS